MTPSLAPREASGRPPVWLRVLLLLFILYAFFVSIELLSGSIKLFGKGLAEYLFTLTSHPMVALFIGIGATSLMQSSSATTSMVVAMVASGALDLSLAVPIVMGANIGTSVTNTLVSMGHIGRSQEFRRAFAASTVHDMFNLLAVAVFFPLEVATGIFDMVGLAIADGIEGVKGLSVASPLKMVVKPAVHEIQNMLKLVFDADASWNPVAWLGLLIALVLLFASITQLTRVLKMIFIGSAEGWFQTRLFNHPLKSLALGLVLTALVQSSSITTSLIVPIAGAGLLTIEQIFPYTLGANIGTTVTAILASLATAQPAAVAIAMVHLLFNLSGTLLVWPVRFIPIWLANKLASAAIRNRFIPVAYVLVTFILLPLGVIFLTK